MSPATLKVPHRGAITACVVLATLMQTLDMTIANVALPHMQGSLSASQDQINWVLTSYIVAAAIATMPTGWLAARFGRARLLLTSVAGFTIASTLCGLAQNLDQIVLFRLLQGMFGAALVPLSQSILLDIYPKEQQGSAMGLWGLGVMVGPILGPTLGGWLTETYEWRWVFFINVPLGVLTLVGLTSFLRDTRRERDTPFDWFGFATLSIGIGAMQLLLDRGEQKNWFGSTEIIVEAAISILGFYWFLVHIFSTRKPFVSPALFKDWNFTACCILIFIVGTTMQTTMALLPPFLQQLMGYPVIAAGDVMAPRGVGTMVAMLVVGKLVNRIDTRILLTFGLLLMTYAIYQMTAWTTDVSAWAIVVTGLEQGFGIGFVWVPLSTMAFATLTPALRTEGASMFSLLRNVGSAIGISIVVSLLDRNLQQNHAEIGASITPFNRLFQSGPAARMLDPTQPGSAALLDSMVSRQALTIAYIDDFKLVMIVGLVVMPLVLLLRKPRKAPAAEPAPAME